MPTGFSIRKRADMATEPPRALLGIHFTDDRGRRIDLDDAPAKATMSTTKVAEGIREGWLTGEDLQVVTRPAGPPDSPWQGGTFDGRNHEFHHYTALTFHTLDGDVRYKVTHQPDKYAADGTDKTKVTDKHYADGNTRVDWFYDLSREA